MPRTRDHQHMLRLGHRLRARREWLGLTQAEVAAGADIAGPMVQKYERGDSDPPSGTLLRLAIALSTTATALLAEDSCGKRDPAADAAAELLADPAVSSILRLLKRMDPNGRRMAHALVGTIERTSA